MKLSTKPKFIIHGERDELIPLKAVREFYAQLPGAEGARRDRPRQPSVRRPGQRGRRRARRSAGRTSHARRSNRCRHAHRRRQGAERHAQAPSGPTRWPPPSSAKSLRRAPGLDPREIDDVILGLRDAGGRAGPERRAHRQPARRRPGRCVGGDDQPLLLVGTAGDRVRAPSASCAASPSDRDRRRHRVDEPGADGRQQGLARTRARRRAIRTST